LFADQESVLFMRLRGRAGTAIVMLLLLAMMAVHLSLGLGISRAFHGDEIWTVNAILTKPFGSLIAFVLSRDNHPPLYYVIAKSWTLLGFASIPRVRLLSYLFSLLTLISFYLFHRRYRIVSWFAPCLLLATNPLLTYYAATVRPYALVVFLSSLLILSALTLRIKASSAWDQHDPALAAGEKTALQVIFYGTCLALGLTHYYGTLLAMILLAWDLLEKKISANRLMTIVTMLALLVWPILQTFFGSLDVQIQSNQWVKVVPFLSTFNNLMMAIFPLQLLSKQPHYIFSLALLIVLLLASLESISRWQPAAIVSRFRAISIGPIEYLAAPILVVYLFSVFADFKTPFSTPYYFLVCLPAAAVLFGILINKLSRRISPPVASLLLVAVVSAQWLLAVERIRLP